jgi:hypothetical protein
MNHTNHPRNTNEEQLQPQQTPNPTARTEENNRETTEGNAGVTMFKLGKKNHRFDSCIRA